MEFPVLRNELLLVSSISCSLSYQLQQAGDLSPPTKWCGGGLRFCLRTALKELAVLNNLLPPSDAVILEYWNSIIQIRDQKKEAKLAIKA